MRPHVHAPGKRKTPARTVDPGAARIVARTGDTKDGEADTGARGTAGLQVPPGATHGDRAPARPEAFSGDLTNGISVQTLIDLVPDILWIKDLDSRFVLANKALAHAYGRAAGAEMIGLSDKDIHPAEAAAFFRDAEVAFLASGRPITEFEDEVIDAHGHQSWLLSTQLPVRDEDGTITGLFGMGRDVTERRRAEEFRERHSAILEMIAVDAPLADVLAAIADAAEGQLAEASVAILLLTDDATRLRLVVAPRLPEALAAEIDGTPVAADGSAPGLAAFRREPVLIADTTLEPRHEPPLEQVAPHLGPLWASRLPPSEARDYCAHWSYPIVAHDGDVLGAVSIFRRVPGLPGDAEQRIAATALRIAGIAIARRRSEERIRFLATHDPLTGLPNRTLLVDRLEQSLKRGRRDGEQVTVAFVGLDNFKLVNDNLGHAAGDLVLAEMARRMTVTARGSDTVARFGGDEFVILMDVSFESVEETAASITRVAAAIEAPLEIGGCPVSVTCSIGVARAPENGDDAASLLTNADAAMSRVKAIGRNGIQFFEPAINKALRGHYRLQQELRGAIERSEFFLLYQPQADLRSGRIVSAEALIRWRHPRQGLISPGIFIPLAEETGVIVALGDWVLREACRQARAWHDHGLPPIAVSVNVSARQIKDGSLVERVSAALAGSGLPSRYLDLEVTESLIMQDVPKAVEAMLALHALGVTLAIDDFGTGYSSLSALKTFPVGRIKIDKSFVDSLATEEKGAAVFGAIISLAQKLGMRVIAEGVETEEQLALLIEHSCDEMQGYLLSRPVAADELAAMLATQSVLALSRRPHRSWRHRASGQ